MPAAIAANTAALPSPPSNRANASAEQHQPDRDEVAGSRNIQMLTPKTCVAAAINGTSGGWST